MSVIPVCITYYIMYYVICRSSNYAHCVLCIISMIMIMIMIMIIIIIIIIIIITIIIIMYCVYFSALFAAWAAIEGFHKGTLTV